MAPIVINAVAFSGLPDGTGNAAAWQPTGYEATFEPIGVTLVAANGTRNRVRRGTTKRRWVITWERTNAATVTTLRTINGLATSFAFTDPDGGAYTVQIEDALPVTFNFIDGSGTTYWDVTLNLYEV